MSLCLSPRYHGIFVKIHAFLSYLIISDPTITLPTWLSNNSSVIDTIFVSKQVRLNFAGIINNKISGHQVIAINMNLVLPPQKINYIAVFSNSDHSKINFKNHFESKSVYDRLNHEWMPILMKTTLSLKPQLLTL